MIQTLLGEGNRLSEVTVFKIRLPRIVAVLVAGAAMGLSGCLVQTLIRNRLATPDMIGVNEGPPGHHRLLPLPDPRQLALVGRAAGRPVCRRRALCPVQQAGEQGYLFVVIGIGVSELMNAIGQFVMSTQSLVHLTSLYLWNMGNFVGQGYSTVLPVGILILLVCPWIIYLSGPWAYCVWAPSPPESGGERQSGAARRAGPGHRRGGARHRHRRPRGVHRHGGPGARLLAQPGSHRAAVDCRPVRRPAAAGQRYPGAGAGQPHEVATGIMTRILGGLLLLFILLKDRQKAD